VLAPGAERQRQLRLDWWGRFQTADGWLPASARVAVAGGIVASVLSLGGSVGSASVVVYNGFARPLQVKLGTQAATLLAPRAHFTRDIEPGRPLHLEARTAQGQLLDSLDVTPEGSFGQFVVRRPGLAPLVELFDGSRATLGVIRRNLKVSLAYNLTGGTLAVLGLIHPLIAAVMMPLSSLSVLFSSSRTRGFASKEA